MLRPRSDSSGVSDINEVYTASIFVPGRSGCRHPGLMRHRNSSVIQHFPYSTTLTGFTNDICSRTVSSPVDFVNVSTIGLESSPVAAALAGLRANEARYFKNKYDHEFTVEPAAKAKKAIDLVQRILRVERDIVVTSPPIEATTFQVENIRWTYVFYESGLSINVLYTLDGPKPKRAVGFKLSEGMEVPAELASQFKFARQKSKLAGTIRGSYFVLKNEY